MTVPNGSFLRVSFRWHGVNGQDVVNVYHYKCNFTASQQEDDVMTAIQDTLEGLFNNVTQYMAADATKGDIKVDRVELVAWPEAPEGQPPWKEEIVANVGWVDMTAAVEPPYAGDPLPPGVAALVYYKTSRGRSPGKTFWGNLVEAMSTGSDWHADLKSAMATVIAGILSGITISAGNTMTAGVLSRATQTFLEFVSGELKSYAGYQRRRRPGKGG